MRDAGVARSVYLALSPDFSRVHFRQPCGPHPSSACLFDHLVGAQQDRWGYCKAERHGGPAVHDHLEPGRDQQVFILAETGERLDRTDIRFGLAQDRGSRSDKRGLAL